MPLNDQILAFLHRAVSIVTSSRDEHLIPSLVRARGWRAVGAPATRLRIFVSSAAAAKLLDDVRRTQRIATAFSHPGTHHAMQFKGTDAIVTAIDAEDAQAIARCVDAFTTQIATLGYEEHFLRTFIDPQLGDDVAIEFTPTDVFQQTPGPNAGARLVTQ
jgi:hypothetical protein